MNRRSVTGIEIQFFLNAISYSEYIRELFLILLSQSSSIASFDGTLEIIEGCLIRVKSEINHFPSVTAKFVQVLIQNGCACFRYIPTALPSSLIGAVISIYSMSSWDFPFISPRLRSEKEWVNSLWMIRNLCVMSISPTSYWFRHLPPARIFLQSLPIPD